MDQDRDTISPKLARLTELSRQHPKRVFCSLHQQIDLAWLQKAFQRTRKDGAVGVDGQTAAHYAAQLETNLQALLERFRSGSYHAPPVRRVHLPKGDGRTRPIGIPTFEDKVLQRAVTMLLEPLYEPIFDRHSYGFRPGHRAHDAVRVVRETMETWRGGWVIDGDIQSYFDTIDHRHLRVFLDERVTDGTLRRTIHKWLSAGVMEEGITVIPEAGTPQGGVLSPLLANVYLHHVLDVWFRTQVQPRLRGRSELVRYADDFVLLFEHGDDARRVYAVLAQRFARFGLTLHPKKTRLLPFKPERTPAAHNDPRRGATSFTFLGFVFLWRRSDRTIGPHRRRWWVQRLTMGERFTRSLRKIRDWLFSHFHDPIRKQWEALNRRLRGYFQYYDIAGNRRRVDCFVWRVGRLWKRALSRRSQKSRMTWERFAALQLRFPLVRPASTTPTVKGSV